MALAVESLLSYLVLLIKLIRQCIEIGLWSHGLVKGSVKNSYLRRVWQYLLASQNSSEVGRVVQRSKVDKVSYCLYNVLIDYGWLRVVLPAMNNPVANSIYLRVSLDYVFLF